MRVVGGYLGGELGCGAVDQGHGVLGEVAALLDLPFVVGLHEHGAVEPGEGALVGKDADDVGASLDLLVDALEGLVDQIFFLNRPGFSGGSVLPAAAAVGR